MRLLWTCDAVALDRAHSSWCARSGRVTLALEEAGMCISCLPCAARAYCKKRGTNFYPWRAGCNAKLPQESVSRIRATGALRVLRARSSTGLPTVRISDGAGCYTSLAVEAAMTQMNCNHAAGMFD